MNSKINLLLNIKPAEAKVVKRLFLVQFFLGIATAFLFTSTLAMFLHTFEVREIPKVYLVSAGLLLIANTFYARLEASLPAKKVLQAIILFSTFSILLTWAAVSFLAANWLPFVLSAWNMVVYMLVGYAFWGMAAIIFNVRESKRLFSVVGAGDIPAKLLGYTAVSVLAPVLGVENLLWFSIVAFVFAYYFLKRFEHHAISVYENGDHGHANEHHEGQEHTASHEASFISRYFQNRLIFCITIFSLIAFTVSSLLDYTLLAEVKSRFTSSPQLATFIGVFFAVGRVLALLIKLVFSSRMISRLGLSNSLLIAPVILLLISAFMLIPGESEQTILYTFGIMVLLSEVLKSAVQEPAFFVLFQPLDPHSRLKGHLISKGYTMPFALLITGAFLAIYKYYNEGISIVTVCQILVGLQVTWIASVFLIKKEYLHTLVNALKKGYFTGSELFLNDKPVRDLLLQKLESTNPKEVILALELLERSGYKNLNKRLLPMLNSPSEAVTKYVLSRVTALKLTEAFSLIEQRLQHMDQESSKPAFIQAYYFLSPNAKALPETDLLEVKKGALTGLFMRKEGDAQELAFHSLEQLARSEIVPDRLAALDVLSSFTNPTFVPLLELLLRDPVTQVAKKAIEAVGKMKATQLLPLAMQVAQERKFSYSLQKAFVHLGDEFFTPQYMPVSLVTNEVLSCFVKGASKVKGEVSTRFLLQILTKQDAAVQDETIESLWFKNASIDSGDHREVEAWLKNKLGQTRQKALYHQFLVSEKQLPLLVTSLASELKQDCHKLLKGLALLYDRQQVNRVMDLLSQGAEHKLANAIEMLEELIPKRYFIPLEALLDYQLDKDKHLLTGVEKRKLEVPLLLKEIVTENPACCSAWTKSVACYCMLEVPAYDLAHVLETASASDELFAQTRGYVLSQLTPSEKCY